MYVAFVYCKIVKLSLGIQKVMGLFCVVQSPGMFIERVFESKAMINLSKGITNGIQPSWAFKSCYDIEEII